MADATGAADPLLGELAQVGSALGPAFAPTGVDDLLRSLTATARQLFGAAACSIALLDDESDELVYTTAAGSGAEDVTGMRIPSTSGVAGWVVQSGQPVAVSDPEHDPRFARDVAETTGYVPRAILALPVTSPRRVLGVLTLLDRDAARPGADRDMATAQLFADQAALAIESAQSFAGLGRALLGALADAAGAGSSLAEAAGRAAAAAGPADRDLLAVAALLADLARQSPAERRLAVTLLREVAAWSRARAATRP